MRRYKGSILVFSVVTIFTAAVIAAVFFGGHLLPGYSKPSDKTVTDEATGVTIIQKQRHLEADLGTKKIWELPDGVLAQDFLVEDIDHEGRNELVVLCWKRGRYGERRPTWVKRDEIGWSQHIFIYEIEEDSVVPKWMASDIGMKAASWEYRDGVLLITDTYGVTTKWIWNKWGLEKI